MPCPLLIFSQSDYLIHVVDTNSNTEWQTVQIQISWLLQKPTDLDLHCLQRKDISGFSRTKVKSEWQVCQIFHLRDIVHLAFFLLTFDVQSMKDRGRFTQSDQDLCYPLDTVLCMDKRKDPGQTADCVDMYDWLCMIWFKGVCTWLGIPSHNYNSVSPHSKLF